MDSDAQQEFVIIKDSLSKVRLPKELKVEDSRQGVRRGEQGRIVTFGKCARYAETSVKLLSTINPILALFTPKVIGRRGC